MGKSHPTSFVEWIVKRLGLIVDGRINGSAWAVKRGVFDFREQNKAIKEIVIDHDLENWFEFLNLIVL